MNMRLEIPGQSTSWATGRWNPPARAKQEAFLRPMLSCEAEKRQGNHPLQPDRLSYQGFQVVLYPSLGVFPHRDNKDSSFFKLPCVIRHPVKDKPVKAITSPVITAAQCFKNHQGFIQLLRPVNGPVQAIVPIDPPKGSHPVENIIP